jgi:hypothetical protein
VRKVSIELEREPGCKPRGGAADGARKDVGATGLRIVIIAGIVDVGAVPAALRDGGGTVLWLLVDVAMSSGDSVTESRSDAAAGAGAVALIVAAITVEVVPTVGDGEGARGGADSTGPAAPSSSVLSEISESSGMSGESFVWAPVSGCGGEDPASTDSEDRGARDPIDCLGWNEDEVGDSGGCDSGVFPFCDILLGVDLERACAAESLVPGTPSREEVSSKPGGGPCTLTSEADA